MLFRRMHKFLVPLLLGLTGVVSLLVSAVPASADVVARNPVKEMELRQKISLARAPQLRTSAIPADPETVWVGHVSSGGYGPYHIGRGPNHAVGGRLGSGADYNGIWDFDRLQVGEPDSLMGWWPIQGPFGSVGPSDKDDFQRSFFGLDYGNNANYVIPQGSPKRTFGVVGIWHADAGNAAMTTIPGTNPLAPAWTPISGSKSMWCGIRGPGDVTVSDPLTGNPFNTGLTEYQGNNNGRQIGSQRSKGTDHNFPGYGSQWDQILYRDVLFSANATGNTSISFKYKTNMSKGYSGAHSSQTGYFMFDPLKQTSGGTGADGNFISAALSAAGPADSFMVYVGAPVEVVPGAAPLFADFFGSDGVGYDIYDQQRRWFSEVLKTQTSGGLPGGAATWKELLSVSGVVGHDYVAPVDTNGATFSTTLTSAQVNTFLDADGGANNGGRLRIVFRVKTNRGFDDENQGTSGFNSGGEGAAIIDDVNVSAVNATTLNETFEGTNGGVDNDTGVAATAAWKSTGKPPGTWFHLHNVETGGLPYDDPCGALQAPVRFCNMGGNVLSPGLHELGDKTGGVFGSNIENQWKYIVSPTINLMNDGIDGHYNGMGIDHEIASRVIQLYGDQVVNIYDYATTGNGFRFGFQAYPATQANGSKCWGEMRKTSFFFSSTVPAGCFYGIYYQPTDVDGTNELVTTNPSGVPDSIRFYIESQSRCFTLPLTGAQCSPATGPRAGGYFDNISAAFVTAPPPPALGFVLWNVFNDAFPDNSQSKIVNTYGLSYDTLAARVKIGYNIAPNATNDITGPGARENIPGDSAIVTATGDNVRCDLVFRILPGVGNYVTIGTRSSGVARRPDTVPRVAAAPGDVALPNHADRFWGAYMADNGAFGTGGNGTTGPGHPSGWDPNKWNSARMDTVEVNHFLGSGFLDNGSTALLTPDQYMSYYHESDPKYAVLGIDKGRCYIQNPAQKINGSNINCGSLGGGGTHYPPDYIALVAGTGYSPSENGLAGGHTYEFTKIIPDGQLTPGALVQYFFRKSFIGDPVTTFSMSPDTNVLFNDSADPHRYLEFGILADRWKDPGFGQGGTGMACMLVFDLADGRGDELAWVSMADSIGLTSASKRGAATGWRARPDASLFADAWDPQTSNGTGPPAGPTARADNGGQQGSLYDFFETIAGESNVPSGRPGSRGAAKNSGGSSLTIGRWSTLGPSGDMARNYREMFLLASDIGPDLIGPLPNQTDDDIGLFTDFLNLPGGAPQPRYLYAAGYRLGDGLADPDHGHPAFLQNFLRATLRNSDYRATSGNAKDVADLLVQPVVGGTTLPQTYGVGNFCFINNDVFNVETPSPSGQVGSYYENTVSGGPWVASVYAPTTPLLRNFVTQIDGWTIGLFGGGFGAYPAYASTPGGQQTNLLNVGVRKYFFDMLTHAFANLTCQPTGAPVGVGDNPGSGSGSAFVNFMNLKSSNPMRSGEARIAFGLAKTDKVEVRVYDVSGRLVKMVANRTFAGGQEHVVTWDGTDEVGNKVKSGVYFYQLKTNSWTSQKKLAVLTN